MYIFSVNPLLVSDHQKDERHAQKVREKADETLGIFF